MKKWIALLLALSLTLGIGAAGADGWLDWLKGIEPEPASAEAGAEPAAAPAEDAAVRADETPDEVGLALQALMDENDLIYTYAGKMDDDSDHFFLSFGSDAHSYYVDIYLLPDGQHGELRIWNLIDYAEADFSTVLEVIDSINGEYKYVTLQTDRSDNSVTASLDLIYGHGVTPEQAADITVEALIRTVQIIRDVYPLLEPYNK